MPGVDRLEMLEVLPRSGLPADRDVGRVGMDDRRPRIETSDRILDQPLLGLRRVRIAGGRRRSVQGDLDDHGHLGHAGACLPQA